MVRLVSFEGKDESAISAMLETAVTVLARELELEAANIFITYEEARSGRVFSGGEILHRSGYTRKPFS